MPSHVSLEEGEEGEGGVTTEAEKVVMWPRAKECQQLPALGRDEERVLLQTLSRRVRLC